jgi:hypothetical protein
MFLQYIPNCVAISLNSIEGSRLRGVKQSSQLVDCFFEFLRAAEQARDLDHIPSLRNRRDFEDVGNNELRGPMLGVFF